MGKRSYVVFAVSYAERDEKGKLLKGGPYLGGVSMDTAWRYLTAAEARWASKLGGRNGTVVRFKKKRKEEVKPPPACPPPVCAACGYDAFGGRDPNFKPIAAQEEANNSIRTEVTRLSVEVASLKEEVRKLTHAYKKFLHRKCAHACEE